MDLPEPPPEDYPRAFGNYVLLAPLARGGMGDVFLGKHGSVAGLEKHCVVKTLRPHLTDDREYTARFIDEARIVVQLSHRNICHVFDVGTVGERYYLAMEYIAGKDLRSLAHDVAEKGGVVNPGVALHIVCETLEALDYAHRHVDAATGKPMLLVHRDVSPQNVMLSWEGEVKLIDFGLAASTLKIEQTSPNVVMGKLAYMAPEQVRGDKVDGRADLFAVGVVLYELLVGERFYEGRSPYEIWGLAAQGGFRPRRWEAVQADMKPILDRALAGDPASRQTTCLELREALQKYRFAKTLHVDAPMLRALMHQLYSKDVEESRRTLSALSMARIKDPLSSRASGVFSVASELTVSLARSPSTSLSNKGSGKSTEPTGMTSASVGSRASLPRLRKQPPFRRPIAAAILLLLVGIIAGAAVWMNREEPVVVEPEPLRALDLIEPTLVVPPPVDPVIEPAVEPVIEPAPHQRLPRPPRPPKDVVVVKVPEAPKANTPRSRVLELMGRCPALECTKKVAVHSDTFGRLDSSAMQMWKADVAACRVACGLPAE